ncbi:MAG: sodium/solute symporter, partial [Planctomycetota bacterium]|nr:sodium/solute symporter [Planctomycetota bacterium]
VLATSLSAVTFLGAPEDAYRGDLTYLSLNLGAILAAILVALFFIPAYYRAGVTTVYELLENRFGASSRRSASAMFMVGRVFASGARLFVASIAVALLMFGVNADGGLEAWKLCAAIVVVALVAAAYTSMGGIGAVIWTDTAQVVVLLGAAVTAIVMLAGKIPLAPGEIVEALSAATTDSGGSKLAVVDLSPDPARPYTLWSAIFGFTLFNMAAYGTDQDLAQRMLTCRSAARGSWSVIVANLMGLCVVAVFLLLGLLLYVYYERPDLMGDRAPTTEISDTRQVFLTFILSEIPPGLRGLMIAGLFAAAMSSLDSALNAMASTAVCDFYRPLRPDRDERHYLRVSRAAVWIWAAVLAGVACVCVFWQRATDAGLLRFALGVMIYAYAGLLGVFLAAIFTRRGNARTTGLALVAGFVAVAVLQFGPIVAEWIPTISLGWRMLVATLISLGICVSGAPRRIVTEPVND